MVHNPWIFSKKKADRGVYELTKTEEVPYVCIEGTNGKGTLMDVQDVTTTVHLDLEKTPFGWRVRSADFQVRLHDCPFDLELPEIACPQDEYSLDPTSAVWKLASRLQTPLNKMTVN